MGGLKVRRMHLLVHRITTKYAPGIGSNKVQGTVRAPGILYILRRLI
jgi:hypothetical protein